jgi:two-component system, OmpR family, alkaline phosphatase synthesis response regulator PhoP
MAKKILVIDDEPKIVEICQDYLIKAGFDVFHAYDGPTGLAIAHRHQPDLVVLDLMMPEMDGLDVCRELRRESNVPIIMLTARVEETDKLIGLEMGADDYMTKPFSPRELVARVRTVLRRGSGNPLAEVIHAGDLTLDRGHYSARFSDREIPLTPTEFELLATLASQPGRIFSRAQLLIAVRGVAFESYERAIDSHIRNLRKKIEPSDGSASHIITVHGAGYKFIEANG